MAAPALLSLSLRDFRNHRATRLETGGAAAILLTGPNGAGKTAVLEALSLLSVGKGLRASGLSELACTGGAGGFAVRAALLAEAGLPPVAIETSADPAAPERRRLLVESAPAPLARLSEWLSVVWLTPAMDRLFADGASARRRFLDRLTLALHPGHARHATRYEAAMRQRNRLLAGEGAPDPAWMDALEREMGVHGEAVALARADLVARLNGELVAAKDAGFPQPVLAIEAPPSDLAARLAAARAGDRAAGRTLVGPHRADLDVRFGADGRPAALASTGEQKALLVSILLAHARLVAEVRGRPPLLLLDEAAAHLDEGRRGLLWTRLGALGGQLWVTGTDAGLFDGLEAARFRVLDGMVTKG